MSDTARTVTHTTATRHDAKAMTPMAFVRAMVRAYEQRGMDPGKALEQAQIAPSSVTQPAARITAAQMERVSAAAMQELDDEALGWFSRRLPWGSYGLLARASLSAPHLGLALQRWCRHHGLLTDDIGLALTVADGVATLALHEHRELGELREFCLVSVLRNVHGLASWFIASRLPLAGADFPFAAPPHADVYPLLFPGGPVRFGQPGPACLRFDAGYLPMPLRRDEAALNKMLRQALSVMVRPNRRDRLLIERVRQALHNEPLGLHNADALAASLHMSTRTLHRQLKDEGVTLQALKDEVRRERAIDALQRSHKPIKQVALAAGFANEKSFIRAFRGWTGQTPAAYRREQGG